MEERVLWQALKGAQLGLAFTRQVPTAGLPTEILAPGLWACDWHCSRRASLPAHASLLEPSPFCSDEHTRRRPEGTALYQCVAGHWAI